MEAKKIEAEIANVMAQTAKLQTEVSKIIAETSKINAETRWYPFVAGAAFVAAIIALTKWLL